MESVEGMYYENEATRITPRLIGGKRFVAAIKVNAGTKTKNVVNGSIVRVVDLGGGNKQIVCGRMIQTITRSVVVDGDTQARTYPVLLGGNIAPTHETQRLFDVSSSSATRGSDVTRKASKGMAIPNSKGELFEIYDSGAMEVAPDEVAWQGRDPITPVSQFIVATTPLMLQMPDPEVHPLSSIRHRNDQTDYFDGGAVMDPDGTATGISAKVFDNEPNVYPPTATFGSAQEYYLDRFSGEVILSSACATLGTSLLFAYWWRDIEFVEIQANAFSKANIEGIDTGLTGHALEEDNVSMVGQIRELGPIQVVIYKAGDDAGSPVGWGEGAIEFRESAEENSATLFVYWRDGVVEVWRRQASGGQLEQLNLANPIPANIFSDDANFFIRFDRTTDTEFTVDLVRADATFIRLVDTTLNLQAGSSGLFGVSVWADNKVQVGLPAGNNGKLMENCRLSELRLQRFDNIQFTDVRKRISTNAIDRIDNLTAGIEMLPRTTTDPRRNRYRVLENGDLEFTIESTGDLIRVTYEQDENDPDIPGIAPRSYTRDGATEGSTDVNQNRYHWHDAVYIRDPHDRFDLTDGMNFEVVTGAVFSETAPPSVRYSLQQGETQTSGWIDVPASEYIGLWPSGIVLFSEDFIDSLPSDARVCFRLGGVRFEHRGSFFADVLNHLNESIDKLDDGWMRIGGAAGSNPVAFQAAGNCIPGEPGITDQVVVDCFRKWVGPWAWGTSKGSAYNFEEGFIWDPSLGVTYQRLSGSVAPSGNPFTQIPYCNGTKSFNRENEMLPNAFMTFVDLNSGLLQNAFGSVASLPTTSPSSGNVQAGFVSGFYGLPVPSQLNSIAALGGTCVEAKMRVRFNGMTHETWAFSFSRVVSNFLDAGPVPANLLSGSFSKTRNGYTWAGTYDKDGGTTTEGSVAGFGDAAGNKSTSGTVGFRVLALRDDNRYVTTVNAGRKPYRYPQFRSLGGSVSTGSVTSGQWSIIDARSLVNAMLKFCISDNNRMVLAPTIGVNPTTSADGMAAYCEGLLPSLYVTVGSGPIEGTSRITQGASGGRYVTFDSLSIDGIYARFKLPSGSTDDTFIPINRGPMMQAQ